MMKCKNYIFTVLTTLITLCAFGAEYGVAESLPTNGLSPSIVSGLFSGGDTFGVVPFGVTTSTENEKIFEIHQEFNISGFIGRDEMMDDEAFGGIAIVATDSGIGQHKVRKFHESVRLTPRSNWIGCCDGGVIASNYPTTMHGTGAPHAVFDLFRGCIERFSTNFTGALFTFLLPFAPTCPSAEVIGTTFVFAFINRLAAPVAFTVRRHVLVLPFFITSSTHPTMGLFDIPLAFGTGVGANDTTRFDMQVECGTQGLFQTTSTVRGFSDLECLKFSVTLGANELFHNILLSAYCNALKDVCQMVKAKTI